MIDFGINPLDLVAGIGLGMAFTSSVAKEIGKRHKWTCEVTGKRFQDGWLLDMAHRNHDRNSGYYNEERNGRPLTRLAHLEEHIKYMIGFYSEDDRFAVGEIGQRCWGYYDENGMAKEGLRTYKVYGQNPKLLDEDRKEVVSMFEKYSLDIREFVNLDVDRS